MTPLPSESWPAYLEVLREIGERRAAARSDDGFLAALGLVDDDGAGLSALGERFFTAQYIRDDHDAAATALAEALEAYAPAVAIRQMLFGTKNATKAKAETVLRSYGFGAGLTERSLGTLLTIMVAAGQVSYARGSLRVLSAPQTETLVPECVLIGPDTPYGNEAWMRRLLGGCEGDVIWFDKHLMPPALDWLWESADGARQNSIRLLSLRLEGNSSKNVRRRYLNLQRELAQRGIALEWRMVDPAVVKKTHDRWIVDSRGAYNVPNVNAISTGQLSEINRSSSSDPILAELEGIWERASELGCGAEPGE